MSYKTIRERCFGLCASIKWSTPNATVISAYYKKLVDNNKTKENVEHHKIHESLWAFQNTTKQNLLLLKRCKFKSS